MHPLEVILQLQLGSDQAAVLSLPSIISSLTPTHFEPSPHLQKWILRVTSLIHSKHLGARWAGLCLALQTSTLSKDLMTECAQNWLSITLPMISRHESLPTWKACIRLLDHIFSSAAGIPEFQRQIAMPNVPKFSAALISLVEKNDDQEIRHTSLSTLTHLIPLYPTLHRALYPTLYTLSLGALSGSSTTPTPSDTIHDACTLHAVLHFTGGKVGAAPLWRKSLDTALANAWFAFGNLRTSFPQLPRPTLAVQPTLDPVPSDPVLAVPLSLDRLKCSIALIKALLRAVTSRPVPVPVGELVKFSLHLLRCTADEAGGSHFDAPRRALELAVIPDIWKLGCELVSQLAKSVRHYLNPHLSRIVSHVTHHLEQSLPKSHHIPFLRLLPPLLTYTNELHSAIPPTRLVKVVLPFLTTLLSSKVEVQQQLQEASASISKKGKKRVRGYEGDEVFKVGRGVLCPASEDGEVIEAALDALDPLLSNPHLSTPIQALTGRLLVTLLLELPRQSPSALSSDLGLHGRVYAKILSLCNKHIPAGASGWINSAVGLVVNAVAGAADGSETVVQSAAEARRGLDVLLHPRLPPLLRSLPPVEAMALFRSESVKEDKAVRESLRVETTEDMQPATTITTTTSSITTVEHHNPDTHVQTWRTPVAASESAAAMAPLITAPSFTHPDSRGPPSPPSNVSMPSVLSAALTKAPSLTRHEAAVTSTSEEVVGATNYKDSDEDDEEMPEIDLRSDSE